MPEWFVNKFATCLWLNPCITATFMAFVTAIQKFFDRSRIDKERVDCGICCIGSCNNHAVPHCQPKRRVTLCITQQWTALFPQPWPREHGTGHKISSFPALMNIIQQHVVNSWVFDPWETSSSWCLCVYIQGVVLSPRRPFIHQGGCGIKPCSPTHICW